MPEVVEPAGTAPAEPAPPAPKKPAHRGWPGVGPQLAERLAKIDVFSPADLILHLPLRYEDETRLTMLADVRPGVPAQCEVEVLSCEVTPPPRRQLVARARDVTHWNGLRERGVSRMHRELFESSLASAACVLELMGQTPEAAQVVVARFRAHNLALLEQMYPHHKDRARLIAVVKQGRQQLEEQMAREREQQMKAPPPA